MINVNICLVSKELYPYQKAGIGVYINNLSNMLTAHGHTVYIITNYNNGLENKNKKIHVIGVNPYESGEIIEEYSLAYALSVKKQLEELTQQVRIDLIEFADYMGEAYFAILYKKIKGQFQDIPFILKLHTPTFECYQANELQVPESILIAQEDYTIKNIDYVYAISKTMAETVKSRLELDKVNVIFNPINLPVSQEELLDIENLQPYILFVGRYEKRKGLDYFVKSALYLIEQYNTQLKFIIIGQDTVNPSTQKSVKEEIEQLIPEVYKSQFIWISTLEQTQLITYYAKALICVFPSRFEGFGNVCAEAMLNGAPVVVSSNTGLEEIVGYGKYGIVFENGNQKDLNEKLLMLVKDTKLRKELSKKGQLHAQSFSLERLYEAQIAYYESVIADYKQRYTCQIKSLEEKIIVIQLDTLLRKQAKYIELYNSLQGMQEYNENLDQENKRLIEEWENNSRYIKELEHHKGKYYQELSDALREIDRITDEWQHIYNKQEELYRQLEISAQKQEEDKNKIRQLTDRIEDCYNENQKNLVEREVVQQENERILTEWEVLKRENERILTEWGVLKQENERILTEWEALKQENEKIINESRIIACDNQKLNEQNTILTKELDELMVKMSSRKYLIKKIIYGKKGE